LLSFREKLIVGPYLSFSLLGYGPSDLLVFLTVSLFNAIADVIYQLGIPDGFRGSFLGIC
jgi:hypothetical protein